MAWMETTKRCINCWLDKPLDCFRKHNFYEDGRTMICKACESMPETIPYGLPRQGERYWIDDTQFKPIPFEEVNDVVVGLHTGKIVYKGSEMVWTWPKCIRFAEWMWRNYCGVFEISRRFEVRP